MLARANKSDNRRRRDDAAFLPAALEILETPASPIRAALIWFIACLATGCLVWSWFGTFDIVATSQGKIQPLGRVKVIQSIETGKVRSVPVANGSTVAAGDILVDLDDTELTAEADILSNAIADLAAEIRRRDEALNLVKDWDRRDLVAALQRVEPVVFAPEIPPLIRQREQAILHSEIAQLRATIQANRARKQQKSAEFERLASTIKAQRALAATIGERVSMRSSMFATEAGSRAELINATEGLQRAEADLAELVGERSEASAGLKVLDAERAGTITTFIAENARQRGDAARRLDEQKQQLVKIRTRLQSMAIESPIAGTVQASAITTIGQVVASGAELMRVVPDGSALEIEAYLPNRDVGFVQAGQAAVIKVEAFPFTRYGLVEGSVARVATDAIPEPDAKELEGAAAKGVNTLVPIGNAQRMQNLVFPVTIRPNTTTIAVNGAQVPLKPGMAVTVEIKTGRRRILEYLFSPLAQVANEAMNER